MSEALENSNVFKSKIHKLVTSESIKRSIEVDGLFFMLKKAFDRAQHAAEELWSY
jgi:hypothetical protein